VTYLLDTMIVSYFFQKGRENELALAAQRCSMALVDEVRRELEGDPRRGQVFRNWLGTSNVEVCSIEVGSEASVTLFHLQSQTTSSRGGGERASIALVASDETLTFVTHDKNAMWIALRELWMPGERVLGLPVFLRRLVDEGHLVNPVVLDDIISIAMKPAERPTWWASWRARLAPTP
jgi:hypothetical protein